MQEELKRLASFASCPENLPASPLWLARNGFFYAQENNEVECFSCNSRLDKGMSYERLQEMHMQKSPQCNILRGYSYKNVPLRTIDNLRADSQAFSYETNRPVERSASASSGFLNGQIRTLTILYQSALLRANRKRVFSTEVVNSSLDRLNPDYDLLKKEEARLRTFEDWPSAAHASPISLAREGLFYTGQKDRVQCAFCRGILFNWEPTDVPFEEHRRLYPNCPFVRGLDVGNIPVDKYGADSMHPKVQDQLQQQISSMMIGSSTTRAEENWTCKVCMDAEVNIVFLPCGHLLCCSNCCSNCSPRFRNCPICGTFIEVNLPVFYN